MRKTKITEEVSPHLGENACSEPKPAIHTYDATEKRMCGLEKACETVEREENNYGQRPLLMNIKPNGKSRFI
jgi:hypothetical protein